ncbi:MAG: peptidoglycan-binding protein [bacterium]|nr:peptidoglycan-binding protein [bacterium]
MKTFIGRLIIILSLSLVTIPFFSFAETATSTDAQTIIQQLQEQIKVLQAQIVSLEAALKSTNAEISAIKEELRLTRTLRKGLVGDDVRQLQEFLKQFPGVYPEGLVTGYYGSLTEAAVKRFQEQQGIVREGNPDTTGFGQVGPKTVTKLNEAVGGSNGIVSAPAETTQTPSGANPAVPAIPAQPVGLTGTTTIPATAAVPATPVVTEPQISSPPSTTSVSSPSPTPTPTPLPTPTSSTATTTPTTTPTPTPPTAGYELGTSATTAGNFPYNKAAGSVWQISIRFENMSDSCTGCDTTPATSVTAYFTPSSGGIHYEEEKFAIPQLSRGEVVWLTWNHALDAPAGEYNFVDVIDPDNTVAEKNEGNNVWPFIFTITP